MNPNLTLSQPAPRRVWPVVAVSLLAFILLLALVVSGTSQPLDLTATRFLQQHQRNLFTILLDLLSDVGYFPWAGVGPALALLYLLWQRRWAAATMLTVAQLGVVTLPPLKEFIHRARPAASFRLDESVPTDFSFPSGHAFNTLVVYGCLIYLLLVLPFPRWLRSLGTVAGVTFITAMGLSRVYLGEHWLTDVLAGYAWGWSGCSAASCCTAGWWQGWPASEHYRWLTAKFAR